MPQRRLLLQPGIPRNLILNKCIIPISLSNAGLISVDVPVEATIAQEVEDRMARMKTSSKQVWHKPTKVHVHVGSMLYSRWEAVTCYLPVLEFFMRIWSSFNLQRVLTN